jgi:hypothetical protein
MNVKRRTGFAFPQLHLLVSARAVYDMLFPSYCRRYFVMPLGVPFGLPAQNYAGPFCSWVKPLTVWNVLTECLILQQGA